MSNRKKILVTGVAGFIGFHLIQILVKLGHELVGIDNINDYYDTNLKFDRLKKLGIQKDLIKWNVELNSNLHSNFTFVRMNIEENHTVSNLFYGSSFDYVIHLAAQAGVRYSIDNPAAYIQSNLVGFANIIELSKLYGIKHFIYASSSSVYGLSENIPFSPFDLVDQPVSLYAATKKANELMAHSYSHLFNLPTTGLRFFTVYGPWGRPDMAYFNFTKSILSGKPISLFNHGNMKRDFTFISDVIDGIVSTLNNVPSDYHNELNGVSNSIPYRILNIGNNNSVSLLAFVKILEDCLGKKANIIFKEMQDGDVYETWADIEYSKKAIGYLPKIKIDKGLQEFVSWYQSYYEKV
jgi:UDP-glucuronate 4-epimerase